MSEELKMGSEIPKAASERRTRTGRPRIKRATREAVIRLYNEDMLIKDIATACGISDSSVFRIVREARTKGK